MKKEFIAILPYEPPWQYYVKYKRFLKELNHPFLNNINFYTDADLSMSEDIIKQYDVAIFYYHDPLKQLYPDIYKYAKNIEFFCNKNRIKFINKPDFLSLSSKSIQLVILLENGFKVAKTHSFKDKKDFFSKSDIKYPIFIRHDSGHDSLAEGVTDLFYSRDALMYSNVWSDERLRNREHMKDLVAVEWLNTKCNDGFYRKYRVFVFGNNVISGPLQISPHWFIHNNNVIDDEKSKKESSDFMCEEFKVKEKDFFVKINNVLGLDFSAIDYSYDETGDIIVWEANPHPSLGDWAEDKIFKKRFTDSLSNFYQSKLK